MYNPVQLKKWGEVSSCRRSTAVAKPQRKVKELSMEVTAAELKRIVEDNVSYMKQVSEVLGEIALLAIENNERKSD